MPRLPLYAALLCLFALAPTVATATTPAVDDATALDTTIAQLDDAVFDAFNRCADPGQFKRHASYFASDVEFYHDTGGVTHTRRAMLANTRRYACGHYTRERVPGTLKVYPIKDYGALEQGIHRFCQIGGGCDGEADFTILWQRTAQGWRIARVLSYGHRAAH